MKRENAIRLRVSSEHRQNVKKHILQRLTFSHEESSSSGVLLKHPRNYDGGRKSVDIDIGEDAGDVRRRSSALRTTDRVHRFPRIRVLCSRYAPRLMSVCISIRESNERNTGRALLPPSSIAGSEKTSQVTITAVEDCSYICWTREAFANVLRQNEFLDNVVYNLIGKDIAQKLYSLNEFHR